MVLDKTNLILKEKKTGKVREIPLHIRTINKQIKSYAAKAGIRGKR